MENYQVVWRGPVLDSTGYGIASREYALALDRQGVDVKIETYTWGFPSKPIEKVKSDRLSKLIEKPYAFEKQRILIIHSPPGNIDLKEEDRKKFDRIILNTVWETTKIPSKWLPTIQSVDAVCVPCSHNIAAMLNSGVTVPLYLVPHGADTNTFNPNNNKLLLNQAIGKFVFVSVFDFKHRKNPETLLKAYWEEFSSNDDVLLLIKTYGNSRKNILFTINNFKKSWGMGNETAPLFIVTGIIGEDQLKGIYTLGNAFVLPTRGEGVGLPFIEALSSGIPVIATGWGGQMDFLHEDNSFLVDYKLSPTAIHNHGENTIAAFYPNSSENEGQLWAEADLADLKRQMRFAFKNPELCKHKGERGRRDMIKLTWDHAGVAIKNAIKDLIG
ncbi:glycosyltransferase involved in cell wall biosynthesis [Bacillus sp. SLBN-46]|uniref:glycosyltransferase family 4 protein n=1 Tax=Bacillus sp. SLBN-46 TaxID=3042283 RepID=UPI002860C972|nr:glycosyltransferase family 4 protein [Bacillus sp. SLBN-46]MDR6123331.1 glycosyltransferase involved in cell wall biosynthesis [Bacillus sp. SLBN-46]